VSMVLNASECGWLVTVEEARGAIKVLARQRRRGAELGGGAVASYRTPGRA
jgi:hypothetical protein